MVEKKYDFAADMWGLGCILYEMIYCTYKDKELKNRFAFKGENCYPLSPISCEIGIQNKIDNTFISLKDQMLCILKLLGDLN